MVANVLFLQPLLYAKLLGSWKRTTVSDGGDGGGGGGGGGGGMGGRGLDNNKPLHGNL